jgi:peptidoglycan L-alanyl-D-glutamate endopeptidase CwlK
MINSRSLADLLPRTEKKAVLFQKRCAETGHEIIFTSTFRDKESQDALYAQGRTLAGKKVTNAKGGDSLHQYRVAFDFVPVVNGKAMWDDAAAWAICGAMAKEVGLEWGGYWSAFPDRPHCQDLAGYSLAQYQRGEAK